VAPSALGRRGDDRILRQALELVVAARLDPPCQYEKAPVGPGLSRADRLAVTTY
jgi:hypothetical protein